MNSSGLLPAACALCALLAIGTGGWLRRSLGPRCASDPDTAQECLEHARSIERQGDAWGAARALGRGLARWPADVDLLLARATLLTSLDHRLGAYQDYSQVLRIEPGSIEALRGRARLRLRGLDCEGALEDLERAVRLAPHDRHSGELLQRARRQLTQQSG